MDNEIFLRQFRANEDFFRGEIAENIERYRKAESTFRFTDKDGKIIPDVHLHAVQKTHEFKHGANIFLLDEFETEEKNELYREKFHEGFDLATIPFYWNTLEPEEGKPRYAKDSPKIYRRPAPDLCVEYCKEWGIEPKCHCLNYENHLPKWMYHATVEESKRKLDKRFREIAERYAVCIPSFEVTNETFNGMERNSAFFLADDFVEWSFRTADRYFPTNRLIINDWAVWDEWYPYRGNRSPYFMQIERALRNGVTHLDTIGMQMHLFNPKEHLEKRVDTVLNPRYLYDVMNTYARLGKRLQITEMTIPAYSDAAEDEALQAELLKNLYTVFFSHPAMEAIIYWNTADGYAWGPMLDMTQGENVWHGGLWRSDLSEKPAYRVLRELFDKTWHTDTETDSREGVARLRGFAGKYDITFTHGGKSVTQEINLTKEADMTYKIVL